MRSIRRPLAVSGAVLSLACLAPLALAFGANGPGSRPTPTCPSFHPGNFANSTTINNSYFPLAPGTRFTYQGAVQKTPVVDIVAVTHKTRMIAGVRTIEVRDQVFEAGVLTEDTLIGTRRTTRATSGTSASSRLSCPTAPILAPGPLA